MRQEKELKPIGKVSEIELVYRSKVKPSDRPIVKTSRDAFDIFYAHYDPDKMELVEEFLAMFLNRANKVLGIYKLSSGGLTGTVADPRLLFAAAIKLGACSIILCHNHPSQNRQASKADIELTQKTKQGADLLDLKLLDHLIITKTEGYRSMMDEGEI